MHDGHGDHGHGDHGHGPDHHGHDHHGHDHGGAEHFSFAHSHHHGEPIGGGGSARFALRLSVAALVLAGAVAAASAVMVEAGTAVMVTRFGRPVRVLTEPGLAWKAPAPIDAAVPVDLRLRTTSSGLNDVGTRDGLRILVQAFVAWQVPARPAEVQQFVRAVRNDPDEAARQLRSFVGSALQVTASSFDLGDLVNTAPGRVRLAAFEERLRAQIERPLLRTYGMVVRGVGVERLSLPESTLAATVNRMRSERETVAAQRTAEGLRQAAQIRAEAARDSRIMVAEAQAEAARIEAESRRQAADIQGKAYAADPQLYQMLRSLDTLGSVVGPTTRIVLRTDAAPFSALVQGPPGAEAPK